MKSPTTHNPTNFIPTDYEEVAVLDNRAPEFPAGYIYCTDPAIQRLMLEEHRQSVAHWQAEWKSYFIGGPQYRCAHCGNGTVRYISVCFHRPTGQHVAFGDVCVARLGFQNHEQFRSAKIRSHAANEAARIKREGLIAKFLAENPVFAVGFQRVRNSEEVDFGFFIRDIANKLIQYGSLSEKQAGAFVRALAQYDDKQARRQADAALAGPVPTGRVSVEGEILTTKEQDSQFGLTLKMLVKLDNGSKIWCSVPSSLECCDRGTRISFSVEVEASKDDASFGFGKRPTKAKVVASALTADPRPEQGPLA